MYLIPTESSILFAVIGGIGILGTLVILSYGYRQNNRFERKLKSQYDEQSNIS